MLGYGRVERDHAADGQVCQPAKQEQLENRRMMPAGPHGPVDHSSHKQDPEGRLHFAHGEIVHGGLTGVSRSRVDFAIHV